MVDADLSSTLRDVLDDLLNCSRALHETLDAERDALTEHNLNSLNQHTEVKKELLIRLEALEVQRRQILNNSAVGLPSKQGQDLIIPELEALWQVILTELRECQDANEINGSILRTHHSQTQHALDLLAGRDRREMIYEADGLPAARADSGEIAKA